MKGLWGSHCAAPADLTAALAWNESMMLREILGRGILGRVLSYALFPAPAWGYSVAP